MRWYEFQSRAIVARAASRRTVEARIRADLARDQARSGMTPQETEEAARRLMDYWEETGSYLWD